MRLEHALLPDMTLMWTACTASIRDCRCPVLKLHQAWPYAEHPESHEAGVSCYLCVQRLNGSGERLHAAHGRPHQHTRPHLLYVT